MQLNKYFLPVCFFVCFFVCSTSSYASLMGDSVDIIYSNGANIIEDRSTYDATVGDGLEYYQIYSYFGGWQDSSYTVDISATAIDIKFISSSVKYYSDLNGFVGPTILDLNDSSNLPLTGFENFSAFDDYGVASEFSAGLISFGDDWISFNYSGLAFTTDAIHIDLLFDGVSPVPVPAAAWLFGSGLIGLIGVARRKANA